MWSRRRFMVSLVAVFLVAVFALGFFIVDRRIRPTLLKMAEARARQIATQAINEAINGKVAINIKYEDLIAFRTDARGKVVLLQLNTGEINRISSEVTVRVQDLLRQVFQERIRIPLGQALGSQILAGLGPRLTIHVQPVGTVQSVILSKFEQAGINQTRHRVYMEVTAVVRIVVPLVSSDVTVRSEVPITEAVYMGEVPGVYFGIEEKGGS